jgi:F5/8 type C domain
VNGQYFQVDMQTARTFRQLTLDAAGSNGDYPRGYQVFVSNDRSNWGTAVGAGNPATQLVTISFPGQTARYIKVVQTGTVASNWWAIAKLNAYN